MPVSPTYHPDTIAGDLPASKATRAVFERVSKRLERLDAAERALNADRTLDGVQRGMQLAELRTKVSAELRPALEKAYAEVQSAAAAVDRAAGERLYTGPRTASREELRSFVRRLPNEGARLEFIRENGDNQLHAAVFTAAPYLSGLTAASQQLARDAAIAKHAPDLAASKAELSRVRDRLEQAARAFSENFSSRPHPGSKLRELREAAVQAAAAEGN